MVSYRKRHSSHRISQWYVCTYESSSFALLGACLWRALPNLTVSTLPASATAVSPANVRIAPDSVLGRSALLAAIPHRPVRGDRSE